MTNTNFVNFVDTHAWEANENCFQRFGHLYEFTKNWIQKPISCQICVLPYNDWGSMSKDETIQDGLDFAICIYLLLICTIDFLYILFIFSFTWEIIGNKSFFENIPDRKWILTFLIHSIYLLDYERNQQKIGPNFRR